MFGDKMTGHWMKARAENRTANQVENSFNSTEVGKDEVVVKKLNDEVDEFPPDKRLRVHESRSQSVEKGVQNEPQYLPVKIEIISHVNSRSDLIY